MTCRVDTNWTYHGLRAVRFENKFIAVTVLPERGANIIDITDKSRDRNLLWRSKRINPHAVNLKVILMIIGLAAGMTFSQLDAHARMNTATRFPILENSGVFHMTLLCSRIMMMWFRSKRLSKRP